jgi:hypothetical protein
VHHHASGSTHSNGKTRSLLNINSSLVTNAHEDSSIEAPTPNIFSSNFSPTTSTITIVADALMAIKFNHSKHTIKKGITILTSYSMAN